MIRRTLIAVLLALIGAVMAFYPAWYAGQHYALSHEKPAYTPAVVTITRCNEPEFVLFISTKVWVGMNWPALLSHPQWLRTYLSAPPKARLRMIGGCASVHS